MSTDTATDTTCDACHARPAGHGHFALYCEPCADLPLTVAAPVTHTATCRACVLEDIATNAADDGQLVNDGTLTEEDSIPGWGVTSIASLIDTYLEDGTASCRCTY